MSAVPRVKGFKLGYGLQHYLRIGYKRVAAITFIITKVYIQEVTQKKA